MAEDLWYWMAIAGLPITILVVAFKPVRSLFAIIIGALWKGSLNLVIFVANHGQALTVEIFRAHLLVAKNFLPRNSVLPSVKNNNTVRRD